MSTSTYTFVSTKAALEKALSRLGPDCALDFETTGLDPHTSAVRLVSLYDGERWYLVDFFRIRGGFRAVADLFCKHGTRWVTFNVKFESRFFLAAGCLPNLIDSIHARKAKIGGGPMRKLAEYLLWDLKRDVSKAEQNSNWGAKELTQEQLQYAADDALHTWDWWRYWYDQLDEGQRACAEMLDDMTPAVLEMEDSGMLLDPERHEKIVAKWEEQIDRHLAGMRAMVSDTEVANVNADGQWSDYFARLLPDQFLQGWPRTERTGQLSMKSAVLRDLAGAVPGTPLEEFFDHFASWKTVTAYNRMFGRKLIDHAARSKDGRLRAKFNVAQARTLRFSSSGDLNLQNVMKDKEVEEEIVSVRSSFVAAVDEKMKRKMRLVSLDYSGIELRVLALISGDEALLHDVVFGDVHLRTASEIAGRQLDKKTVEGARLRSAAKAVSFGIVYGITALGLSLGLRISKAQAQHYIDRWAAMYPKAFAFRDKVYAEAASNSNFIRCIDGGTIYMGKRPVITQCANYPVQRAALSIMAKAIARHKETLDELRRSSRHRDTRMLATVHDQLIDQASRRDSKEVLQAMARDMVAGYSDIFPDAPVANLVEGGIGPSWGELTDVPLAA